MTVTASDSRVAPLTILLFGPMQVLLQDRPLPRLRSRKALSLLALLILRQGRPVEREWLAGTLWPDTDQSRASANLRANLSELRRVLGDQGERLQSISRHTLAMDIAGASIDVVAFDAALASKKPEALRRAVALYGGPLLEDCAEEWVAQERNVREQGCLQALQTLADAALAAGDHTAAIDYCQRSLRLAPWRDVAQRGLMEALAKSGDRNAALQVYREFVELLRSDPRAVPDKETTALYARLRAEVRPRTNPQTTGKRSETVLPEAPSPLVSGYLPHSLTNLIGREEERIEVATKLRGSRLVTLTGPGGIGKTRLAIELASDLAQNDAAFTDGVWLVALESLSEGRLVVPQIISVLGLREEAGRPLLESLIDYLRPKRLLLVLDNCEHLLEASAEVVGRILQECARVRILATSRESLGIWGETAWAVPSLAAPDPKHLPERHATRLRVLAGYESVQLFVERAQACEKGFVLTGSNASAVAQMCYQLEGIPLAIELAAARVRAMTVEQIAERLHDQLNLLTGGSRTAQSRQKTLRSTLDWSYDLLSEAERLLLGYLSVFAGGWTLEAAEQVCQGESIPKGQVLNLLTSLVDKSLVVFEEAEGEVGGRYRLLETVRQYAAERLQASGEGRLLRKRHRNWCVSFAEEAEMQSRRAHQAAWLHRVTVEHDNLRAALGWRDSEAKEEEVETLLRLTGALSLFWVVHNHFSEGHKYLEQALAHQELPSQGALLVARVKALEGLGRLLYYQGRYVAALACAEERMTLSRQWGDQEAIANSLKLLGDIAYSQGDYIKARPLYEESLRYFSEAGDLCGRALALSNLGNLASNQGDPMAQSFLEEALPILQELGDIRHIAMVLNLLAYQARMKGDYAKARSLYEESLRLNRELGDRYNASNLLNNLGNLALDEGDAVTAQALYEEALKVFREVGARSYIALVLANLGRAAHAQGNMAEAQVLFTESLEIRRELGERDGIAMTLNRLGNVAYTQKDFERARSLYTESLDLCRLMQDRRGVMENLSRLSFVLVALSEPEKAVRLWGAADALRQHIGARMPLREREVYERQVEETRASMKDSAFATAWEEGLALGWEEAANLALAKA